MPLGTMIVECFSFRGTPIVLYCIEAIIEACNNNKLTVSALLIHPQTVRSIFGSIIFAQASSTLLFFEFVVFRIRCLIGSGLQWHNHGRRRHHGRKRHHGRSHHHGRRRNHGRTHQHHGRSGRRTNQRRRPHHHGGRIRARFAFIVAAKVKATLGGHSNG